MNAQQPNLLWTIEEISRIPPIAIGDQVATMHSSSDEASINIYNGAGEIVSTLSFPPLNRYYFDWCYNQAEDAFYVSGSRYTNSFSPDSAVVVKISRTTGVVWTWTYRDNAYTRILGYRIATKDNFVILAAYVDGPVTGGYENAYRVIKINAADGNTKFVSNTVKSPIPTSQMLPGGICIDNSNNIIVVRNTHQLNGTNALNKFNGNSGLILWQKTLPKINASEQFTAFLADQQNNIYLASEYDMLFKISSGGSMIYQKNLADTLAFKANNIIIKGDTLLIFGQTAPYPIHLYAASATTGDKLWEMTYSNDSLSQDYWIYHYRWASDTDFYLSYVDIEPVKYYVSKYTFNPVSGVLHPVDTMPLLRVYPNPAKAAFVTVDLPDDNGVLNLYDEKGMLISSSMTNSIKWSLSVPEQPGIYWMSFYGKNGRLVSGKIIR